MSVSLSNQVCDNLRTDETTVHTIIIYDVFLYSPFHIPRSQFGSKRVSNSIYPAMSSSFYEGTVGKYNDYF